MKVVELNASASTLRVPEASWFEPWTRVRCSSGASWDEYVVVGVDVPGSRLFLVPYSSLPWRGRARLRAKELRNSLVSAYWTIRLAIGFAFWMTLGRWFGGDEEP